MQLVHFLHHGVPVAHASKSPQRSVWVVDSGVTDEPGAPGGLQHGGLLHLLMAVEDPSKFTIAHAVLDQRGERV